MRRWMIVGSIALALLSSWGAAGSPGNVKCCHGCGRYHCKKANCGDTCQQGPDCRGCWTDCNARAAVILLSMPALAQQAQATTSSQPVAAERFGYQTGKLLDLRRDETGSGAARAQASFCLAVGLDDMTYLVRHEATWRWSYEPSDFVVGDQIHLRIKGNYMYLKKPKGGDLKTYITRRERNAPDQKPLTCALPVAPR